MFDKAAFEVCDGFMNEVSFYWAAKLRKVRLINIPCILFQNCYSLYFYFGVDARHAKIQEML